MISIIIVQQFPIIFESYYSEFRFFLYILLIIGIIFRLLKGNYDQGKLFKKTLFLTIYSLILFSFTLIQPILSYSWLELTVPLGIMFVSSSYHLKSREKENLLSYFVIILTILSVFTVFYYNGGYSISSIYTVPSKNQMGPLMGAGFIIAYIKLFDKSSGAYYKKIYLFFVLVLIAGSLITIRNRTGILGIIIVILFKMIINLKKQNFTHKKLFWGITIFTIFLVTAYFWWGELVISYINESMFANYDLTSIDSIATGRISGYSEALVFLKNNLFFGSLTSVSGYTGHIAAHNYIINKLVQFGIIFSLPFVLYYAYLIKYAYLHLKKGNYSGWLLFFSLFVSLFEYTYPFGPGVSQFMLWFLIAQENSNNLFDETSDTIDNSFMRL